MWNAINMQRLTIKCKCTYHTSEDNKNCVVGFQQNCDEVGIAISNFENLEFIKQRHHALTALPILSTM